MTKLIIGIDLNTGLKLYTVPTKELIKLKAKFPNFIFKFINTKKNPEICKNIDIYWGNRITKDIIKNCKKLKWIHFGSVGVDRARTSEISNRNILITNSSNIMDNSIITSAISFLTNFSRGYYLCQNLRDQSKLTRESFDKYYDQISSLENQTCLIVGYGNIGKKLAKVCLALGMNVVGINQNIEKKISKKLEIKTTKCLSEEIKKADFVINLMPFKEKTKAIFDFNLFKKMKKNCFFINVGRGETVDESSLIKALKMKKIAGAGLDVFQSEPLRLSSPLWKMNNVLITPHIAGLSNDYWAKQVSLFSKNLNFYSKGNKNKMTNIVNMKKYQ